jgi:hypothetical protein
MEQAASTTGAEQKAASGEGGAATTTNDGQAAVDFAGYKTPEELVSAHKEATTRLESLQKQVTDLERIKGSNSGMISQLNEKIAALSGQIEGMKSAAPVNQAQQGPTLDQVTQALQEGKIDEATAIKLVAQITQRETEAKLMPRFQQVLQKEIGTLKEQSEAEKYAAKFLADNPGYKEAYESGKLDPWLIVGPDGRKSGGENAWKEYQLQTTKAELEALKKQSKATVDAAKQDGIDKGLQLAQSKSSAAKVLSGKGGQFSQVTSKYDLKNPTQRSAAGLEILSKMRSGGG